jgi:hypothetical protein
MEAGDKENNCRDRNIMADCPTLHREGTVSTKRKKKPGGFNLRKSIAWNPAFFTEEGAVVISRLFTVIRAGPNGFCEICRCFG